MFFSNKHIYNKVSILISIFLTITGLINLQKVQLLKLNSSEEIDYFKQERYLKTKVKLQQKVPSFSFDNLLANWNFLQFIQYFGDTEARNVTGYSVVTDYFETGVERDPNFIQSHLVMSPANSLFAAEPEKTIELLNRALKTVNPKVPYYPFFLWTYKATDEILFLGDLEIAKESYRMATKWAELRKDELGEKLSQRYQQTAQFLATNPDPTQAQFGAWMNVLSTAKDQKTQDYVLDRLRKLGAEININPDGDIDIRPPKFDKV